MPSAMAGRRSVLNTLLILGCSPALVSPFLTQQRLLIAASSSAASSAAKRHRHRPGQELPGPQRRRAGRILVAAAIKVAVAGEIEGVEAPPAEAGFDELAAQAAARQAQRKRILKSTTQKENTKTDLFRMKKFHHVEFYCGDATAAASRFIWGLGMKLVAKSDQSTGNTQHASYVVQSNDLRFVCTAPYSLASALPSPTSGARASSPSGGASSSPLPGYDLLAAHEFFRRHGLAGRAIGIEVEDAAHAYEQCVKRGREAGGSADPGVLPPTRLEDVDGRGSATISEVRAYGDVVLRFISFDAESGSGAVSAPESGEGGAAGGDGDRAGGGGGGFTGAFLPNFVNVWSDGGGGAGAAREDFGLQRADHIVGNVWDMLEHGEYLAGMTGMHEFAEFAAADVGSADSGLNSIVLASNNEMVLLPLNEPTFGTAKKSQIQTFLEQNDGPGLQHIALKTNDIFRTMRLMKANSALGGFEFMTPPGPAYYREVPRRIPSLTEDQLQQIEELGLLVDKEDEGVLLQVFTKPVGDRPTLFFEIIQRIGCAFEATDADEVEGDRGVFGPPSDPEEGEVLQRGGCGGFGLGNFKALFESIEQYESTLATGTGDR